MTKLAPNIKEKLFKEVTEIPSLLDSSHIASLDGFRGISIIMVIVFHIMIRKNNWNFNGAFGVNIFFVISGFIITTLLLKEKVRTKDISLKNFYIRRSLKIIPVAYVYLIVILLLNLFYKLNNPLEIESAFLFLKNTRFISGELDKTTGHFWSLSVEEQFYLFFPFILKKSINRYFIVIVSLILLIPCLLHFDGSAIAIFQDRRGVSKFVDLVRYIVPILVGALFSILIFKKIIVRRLYPNNLVNNALLLFASYKLFTIYGSSLPVTYLSPLYSILIAVVIVNNIHESNDWCYRILNSKILVSIGMVSYSIYVWQQVFLLQVPWQDAFKYSGTVWFNLIACLIISFASYYFIERPLSKLKDRILRRDEI